MSNENWYWKRYNDIPKSGTKNPVWYEKPSSTETPTYYWKHHERCIISMWWSDYFSCWRYCVSRGPNDDYSFSGMLPKTMDITAREDGMRLLQAAYTDSKWHAGGIEKIDFSSQPQPVILPLQ